MSNLNPKQIQFLKDQGYNPNDFMYVSKTPESYKFHHITRNIDVDIRR